mmetsp:Transcript_35410/g.94266  ORF Transcript_35410/g.94266 Transcript_35410/m.94266 type:complete len:81 (-) Transcript_35410:8-250(-)
MSSRFVAPSSLADDEVLSRRVPRCRVARFNSPTNCSNMVMWADFSKSQERFQVFAFLLLHLTAHNSIIDLVCTRNRVVTK